jgi:hypothetical protein
MVSDEQARHRPSTSEQKKALPTRPRGRRQAEPGKAPLMKTTLSSKSISSSLFFFLKMHAPSLPENLGGQREREKRKGWMEVARHARPWQVGPVRGKSAWPFAAAWSGWASAASAAAAAAGAAAWCWTGLIGGGEWQGPAQPAAPASLLVGVSLDPSPLPLPCPNTGWLPTILPLRSSRDSPRSRFRAASAAASLGVRVWTGDRVRPPSDREGGGAFVFLGCWFLDHCRRVFLPRCCCCCCCGGIARWSWPLVFAPLPPGLFAEFNLRGCGRGCRWGGGGACRSLLCSPRSCRRPTPRSPLPASTTKVPYLPCSPLLVRRLPSLNKMPTLIFWSKRYTYMSDIFNQATQFFFWLKFVGKTFTLSFGINLVSKMI